MRMLLALSALLATGHPNVAKLVLKPAQVGPGYVLFHIAGGAGVKNTVTLDLCGVTGYPSERRRATRLQVSYLKKKGRSASRTKSSPTSRAAPRRRCKR